MKIICLFLGVLVSASSAYASCLDRLDEEWETFKTSHNKVYDTIAEDGLRINLYLQSKIRVADHNQRYHEGKESYLIEINFFSDLLPEEINRRKGLIYDPSYAGNEEAVFLAPHDGVILPDSVDWREEGAVTAVKNQESCGSCWAFSATGSLEGMHFRKTGKLVSLSEQNLVDCVMFNETKEDCNGGYMWDAFTYIKLNNGIDTEASYPYTAKDGDCHFNPTNVGATDKGFVKVKENDEDSLKAAVALKGPISVGINASPYSFAAYKEGVYDDSNCGIEPIDHGVLVVGYGTTDDGKDYWIVKNSWGADWGMKGYILMARNKGNLCGIAVCATYPIV